MPKKKVVKKKPTKRANNKSTHYLITCTFEDREGISDIEHEFVIGDENLLEFLLGLGSPTKVNDLLEEGSILIFDIDNSARRFFKLCVQCKLEEGQGR